MAPFGNKFSKKKYKPEELEEAINEYFEKSETWTVEGLARHLGVVRATLHHYQHNEGYEAYSHLIDEAKERIRERMIVKALKGEYKEGFTKFILINNSDYKDRVEQHNTGETSINLKTNFSI